MLILSFKTNQLKMSGIDESRRGRRCVSFSSSLLSIVNSLWICMTCHLMTVTQSFQLPSPSVTANVATRTIHSSTRLNEKLDIPSWNELNTVFGDSSSKSFEWDKVKDFVYEMGMGGIVEKKRNGDGILTEAMNGNSVTSTTMTANAWKARSISPLNPDQDMIQNRLMEKLTQASSSVSSYTTSSIPSSSSVTGTPTAQNVIDGSDPLVGIAMNISNFLSSHSSQLAHAIPLLGLISIVSFLIQQSNPPPDFRKDMEPYPRGFYDPLAARAYYRQHPLLVLRRSLQLLRISNQFLFNYLVDKYIFKDEPQRRSLRAKELLDVVNRAGATAIKIGQALSVRPDILPPEYANELATLQDRVPPFSSIEAKKLLRDELGMTKLSNIQNLNMESKGPVASASIGQVYKGTITLDNGTQQDVAVKVQRPNVLADIALDLYITREFIAPFQQYITGAATDFQALANEWGRGFIAELDYLDEMKSTMKFNEQMQLRNIQAVIAPTVLPEYCTQKILTTQWVDGERLDRSTKGDVPRLCSVALNAYLVMLLEMSFLHCDPHPGNLLRTTDGKLCILDFGMTLDTDPTLQYSLLEFVAHLTSDNYQQVPEDLVKLGFLKQERLDTVRASGFLLPLTYMLQQAKQGGGGDKVRERIFEEYRAKYPGMTDDDLRYQMRDDMKQNMEAERKKESAVSGITMEVEELQKRNSDAFVIPEWFLYTSRAFLTLEGICLQADENYSIIQSCFPYVARRLLGDDSPRAQQALRDLLYGAGESIDIERLTDLADGFTSYTTTTKTISEGKNLGEDVKLAGFSDNKNNNIVPLKNTEEERKINLAETETALTLAKDSAEILLAPSGNMIQNLIISESALAASAQVKDSLRDAFIENPKRFRDSLPLNIGSILPSNPFANEIKPFLEKTSDEEKAQNLVGKITTLAPKPNFPALPSASNLLNNNMNIASHDLHESEKTQISANEFLNNVDPEQIALVSKELRTSLPKYAPLIGNLGGKFAMTLLERASYNIEQTLIDQDKGSKDGENIEERVVRVAAKNFSTAAMQGAGVLKKRVQEKN